MTDRTPTEHPAASVFAPARVRLRTPRLELRLPTDTELVALAEHALAGVHEPDTMPFASSWTEQDPATIPGAMYQWHMHARASWRSASWTLLLVAFADGEPVGAQDIGATDFATRREVGSGSWLARSHQGRGLGTEMRAAALALAFDGLRAESAVSGAYEDNAASRRVSEKCGYEPNGVRIVTRPRGPHAPGGARVERAVEQRYRITRERWEARRRDGLLPCDVELLGIDDALLAACGAATSLPSLRAD